MLVFLRISSVQLLSHVQLFPTPWPAALQASLSIANSQSLLKLMSIELVMPSPSRLGHDNLSTTRFLDSRDRLTSCDPRTGVGHPQGFQCDQCWVGLRDCNLDSLPVCSQQMEIDTMM